VAWCTCDSDDVADGEWWWSRVAWCTWDSDDVANGGCVDMMAVVAVEVMVAVTVVLVLVLAYVAAAVVVIVGVEVGEGECMSECASEWLDGKTHWLHGDTTGA
jgi:hypothetical protein